MKALSVMPATSDGLLGASVRLYADSSIGRDIMPVFIPDIMGGWQALVAPAYRVNRLGKNIPTKFADRYIDAVSMVLVLAPADEYATEFYGTGISAILDNVITIGRWVEIVNLSNHRLQYTVGCVSLADGQTVVPTQNVNIDAPAVAQYLSDISRVATLKSGDMIIVPDAGIKMPMTRDTRIMATIADTDVLHAKIK